MAATSSLYAGGGIKSIQRGSQTAPGRGATNTATITSVDTSKSFIAATTANGHRVDLSTSGYWYGWGMSLMCAVKLTNATTVTFLTGTSYAPYNVAETVPVIYWEVIEYE